MTLMPGEAGSGIVFKRTDVETAHSIVPATWDHVVATTLCTTIGNAHGVKVGTVEHLMSALAGCAIDNAVIEIDGPEVPIMDGSAAPFVSLIESAEVVEGRAHATDLRRREKMAWLRVTASSEAESRIRNS